jgi:hypothetical protein
MYLWIGTNTDDWSGREGVSECPLRVFQPISSLAWAGQEVLGRLLVFRAWQIPLVLDFRF